jgi:hypothetical protein
MRETRQSWEAPGVALAFMGERHSVCGWAALLHLVVGEKRGVGAALVAAAAQIGRVCFVWPLETRPV